MEVETPQESQVVDNVANKKYHFEIFYNLRLIQQQNGLKHSDFNRYRQFCGRKMRRVRKRVNFLYVKGRNYTKKVFEAKDVKDSGSLFIPLLETERAWSYAMEIKQNLSNQDTSRSHFHLLNRLKKACHSAQVLKSICDETCDTDTCLEAEAYSLYLEGVYNVELDQYSIALDCFTRCKAVLSQLHDICISVLQKVYSDKIKDIEPYIRYCKYNLRNVKDDDEDILNIKIQTEQYDSVLQSKIDKILSEKHNQNKGDLSVIVWNEMKLPVDDEEIRLCLLKIRDTEIELCDVSKENQEMLLDMYSTLFSCFDEANKLISQSIDKISKSVGSNSISNRNIHIYNSLFTYTKYMKLSRMVERNILLFTIYNNAFMEDKEYTKNKKITLTDLLAIISNIIHNLKDMTTLLEPLDDETISPTNQNYLNSVTYLTTLYRAWRTYFASKIYMSVSSYKEAMFLSKATEDFINQLKTLEQNQGLPRLYFEDKFIIVNINTTDLLNSLMTTYSIEVHANAILNKIPITESTQIAVKYNSDTNLLDKLDEILDISGDVKFFEIPPSMTPLATKPLFFDVLLNQMNYDHLNFKQYLHTNVIKNKTKKNISSSTTTTSTTTTANTNNNTTSASTVEEPKSASSGWFSRWF